MGQTTNGCGDSLEPNLNELDTRIIEELAEGDRTIGALSDFLDEHRNTIRYRLDVLDTIGAVSKIHEPTALYTLTNDPRGCA